MKSGLNNVFLLMLLILSLGCSFTAFCQVDKTLSSISSNATSERKKINFTAEEKAWITAHPQLKFTGDPNWLPFEAFTSQGKFIGITADYLKIIASLTGIELIKIPTNSWDESVKLSENFEVDILSETTNANRKHLIFTHAFLENDLVIVMTNDNNYVESLKQIKDKKIAVIKNYGYVEQLKNKYPEIKFIEVPNIKRGIEAVSSGKIDVMVATFAYANYTIKKMGAINVRIVGRAQFTTGIGLGVRRDYAPLVNILNKAIAEISETEKHDIIDRWIKPESTQLIDYSLLWKLGLPILVVLLFVLYSNRKMSKEILKRKQMELALQESQQRFELTIRGSGDALWEYNTKTNENWFSPRFVEMLGYQEGELLPTLESWTKQVHPDDLGDTLAAFNAHLEKDVPYDIEYRMRAKSGEYCWYHARAKSLRDASGRAYRTSGSVSDIGARKKIEAALEKSNFQSDQALDLSKSGYWHINLAAKNEDKGWYTSSERAAKIFGDPMRPPHWRYRIMEEWFVNLEAADAAAAKLAGENFDAAVAGEIPLYDAIYAYKRPADGEIFWIHASGHVVKDKKDKPTDMYGVTQDISEQKRIEFELNKAIKIAQEATQAKSDFLANMSHEIRTPMNAIIGMSHLALQTDLNRKQRNYIEKVHRSGENLLVPF